MSKLAVNADSAVLPRRPRATDRYAKQVKTLEAHYTQAQASGASLISIEALEQVVLDELVNPLIAKLDSAIDSAQGVSNKTHVLAVPYEDLDTLRVYSLISEKRLTPMTRYKGFVIVTAYSVKIMRA